MARGGWRERVSSAREVLGNASRTAGSVAREVGRTVGTVTTQAAGVAVSVGRSGAKAVRNVREAVADGTLSFESVMAQALATPGVRVGRATFLAEALSGRVEPDRLERAIATTPVRAQVPDDVIAEVVEEVTSSEATLAAAASVACGIPSSVIIAVPATVADVGQLYVHVLRLAQQLAYLYGWYDLADAADGSVSEATRNVMMLFVGVMSGVAEATRALSSVMHLAGYDFDRDRATQALSSPEMEAIVDGVAERLTRNLGVRSAASLASKLVPVLGGAASGALTGVTFPRMARRLRDFFASSPLARLQHEIAVRVEVAEGQADGEGWLYEPVEDLARLAEELAGEVDEGGWVDGEEL